MYEIKRITITVVVAFVSIIGSLSGTIFADDAEKAEAKRLAAEKFEATFFDPRRDSSVEVAQTRLYRILKTQLDDLDRCYGLSDGQRQKLELAGRASIKQLIDSIAAQKQDFLSEERDELAVHRYLYENPDVLILRTKLRNGPFQEQSLFRKSMQKLLTPEQAAKALERVVLAKASQRKITVANIRDLVRIAQIPKKVRRIEWDHDGKHVGLLEFNKQLDIYLPLADQPVRSLGVGKQVMGFDFGPASTVATVDSSSNLTAYSVAEGKESLNPVENRPQNLRFSPDGKAVVTGGYGHTAHLWSTATGEKIRDFVLGRKEGGLTPVFSPDGAVLAVGSRNSTTTLFEVSSGKRLLELPRMSSQELKFDPSGATLAIVYVDGQLVLWDVQTGKQKANVQAWADELLTVDWTPDGNLLVTGGDNSPLTFWNASDLSIVAEFESPQSISTARFSPDGSKLIFAGYNRPPHSSYVETWAVP